MNEFSEKNKVESTNNGPEHLPHETYKPENYNSTIESNQVNENQNNSYNSAFTPVDDSSPNLSNELNTDNNNDLLAETDNIDVTAETHVIHQDISGNSNFLAADTPSSSSLSDVIQKSKEPDRQNPTQTNNYFAEESYYDTNPLPNVYYNSHSQNYSAPNGYYNPNPQNQFPNQMTTPAYYNQPNPQTPTYSQPLYRPPQYYSGNYAPPPPPQNSNKTGNEDNQIQPNKKKSKGLLITLIVIGVIIFFVITPIAIFLNSDSYKNSIDKTTPPPIGNDTTIETEFTINPTPDNNNAENKSEDGRLSTEGIAEKASPSVVGILGEASTFSSQGSGIIMSSDGYVITNAHIIQDCSSVNIILNGADEYPAIIVGTNINADIAVLKFTPTTELTVAELGEGSKLKIGEQVITIGNPRGLWGTFTGGYVSGIRDLPIDDAGNTMTYIQTDAPINFGNSGGPLLNMYGQVVGIISSKFTTDSAEGLGFAISIDDALPIIEGIIESGNVMLSVRIGITYNTITVTDAELLGVNAGLYIAEIDPSCDIANTRLRSGDIITHINNLRVYSASDMPTAIGKKNPGDEISATIYRKSSIGAEETFEITFKLMPKQ